MLRLYLLAKFLKLTVLNLTKLVHWEAGSMVRNIVKILYHLENIEIVLRAFLISLVTLVVCCITDQTAAMRFDSSRFLRRPH